MDNTNEFKKERLTNILCLSRSRAGVTQEAMAMELGVARKTIQNWEKGVTLPDMIQTIQWFEVLKMNPMSFLFQFRYPGLYNGGDQNHYESVRKTLHNLIELLPEEGLNQMLYLYYGDHGSDPRGLMHLLTAYLQLPLRDRVLIASTILKDYELVKSLDELTCKEGVQPDEAFLQFMIDAGQEAACRLRNSYSAYYEHEKTKESDQKTDQE